MHRLLQMAALDENYLVWKQEYMACGKKIEKFAKWFPRGVRNILFGYVNSGRMMYQRVLNIACQNMEFIDTDKNNSRQINGD